MWQAAFPVRVLMTLKIKFISNLQHSVSLIKFYDFSFLFFNRRSFSLFSKASTRWRSSRLSCELLFDLWRWTFFLQNIPRSLLWITTAEAHQLELMGTCHHKHTKGSSESEVASSRNYSKCWMRTSSRYEPRDSKKDYVKPSICCRNLTSNSLNLSSPHYSAAFLSTNAYSRMGAFGWGKMNEFEFQSISTEWCWVALLSHGWIHSPTLNR